MKILPLAACCASLLAAFPLRAQEPSPTPGPTDSRAQSEQILQNPTVQQFLRLIVQKVLDAQPTTGADAIKTNDITAAANDLLATLTDGSAGASSPRTPSGSLDSAEAHAPAAPAPREAAVDPALAHVWDSSLAPARLQPSSGVTPSGGLTTGKLHLGGLSPARLQSGSTINPGLPARNFVTPATSASAAASPATVTVSAPPSDPDDEMRRWSRKIDGQFPSEQVARSAAVRLYPELGVSGSAFNTQFRARYAQYRQADPFGFLRGPGWPVKLAIFTDGDLRRQQSGSAVAP